VKKIAEKKDENGKNNKKAEKTEKEALVQEVRKVATSAVNIWGDERVNINDIEELRRIEAEELRRAEAANVLSTATIPGVNSFVDDSLIGTIDKNAPSLTVLTGGNYSYIDETLGNSEDGFIASVKAVGSIERCHTINKKETSRVDDSSVLTMEERTLNTVEGNQSAAEDKSDGSVSVETNQYLQDKIAQYEHALNKMTELRNRAEIQQQAGVEPARIEQTKSKLLKAIETVTKLQSSLERTMKKSGGHVES